MFKNLLAIFGIFYLIVNVKCSVSGYLRPADQNRFLNILTSAVESNDLQQIHYGLQGLHLLKKPIPNEKKVAVCKALTTLTSKEKLNVESLYYTTSALLHLSDCKNVLKEADYQVFTNILSDEKSSIPEIYYSVLGLTNGGKTVPNPTKVVQNLQAKLKTDDTIINLGYTFHIASRLGSTGKFALDRVEEALVQADEVDGKLLQFEGGLSVTSLVLVGINKLYQSQQTPTIVTKEQAEKFANYLVSRRSVQTVKGVCCLIDAVRTFTDNPQLSPASIGLASSGQATSVVAVRVCDILGNPLGLPPDSVIAQSATRLGDDVVVLAKQKLVPTSNPTIYNLELPKDRMAAGLYKVVISAGSHTASLTVTALANGAISFLDIGVVDADQISTAKLQKLTYPSKLQNVLEADSQQALLIKFGFVDSATKKPLKIQQAFLRLSCLKTKREIVFIAECDSNNIYTINLDVGSKAAQLGGQSGSFEMSLILGDTVLINPIIWELGQLNVKIPATAVAKEIPTPVRGPKPEIHHLFREPERRPPQAVSMFFSGLVIAPLLLLFILWIKIGVNVSNFKLSLGSIGFQLGLAGIFILYGIFWLSLNMFQTSRWLLLLGLITFLSGHRLLRSIAEKRKH